MTGFSRESTGFGIHDDLWWVWLCFDRTCFNYSINCNGKPSLDQLQRILPDGRNFIDYPIHDSTKIIRINQLIWMQKPWSAWSDTDVPLNYSNVGKTITINHPPVPVITIFWLVVWLPFPGKWMVYDCFSQSNPVNLHRGGDDSAQERCFQYLLHYLLDLMLRSWQLLLLTGMSGGFRFVIGLPLVIIHFNRMLILHISTPSSYWGTTLYRNPQIRFI